MLLQLPYFKTPFVYRSKYNISAKKKQLMPEYQTLQTET